MPDLHFPRLAGLPEYALGLVEERKDALRKSGVSVYDFGLGNPDRGAPDFAVAALRETALRWENHRYLASPGQAPLRAALRRWYLRRYGVSLDEKTEMVATIGAKEGIAHLMFAVIGKGDVVLAPDPCYPIHRFAVYFADGHYQPVKTGLGLHPVDELRRACDAAPRPPKLALINYPHNPSTAVVDGKTMEAMVRFAEERDLWLVSDLAYADYGFHEKPPSLLAVDGARARCVEITSVSKAYNMPGFRCGFVAGNATLVGALRRMKSYQDYDLFAPIQHAATAALDEGDAFSEKMRALYLTRARALTDGLNAAGWSVPMPTATMFVWAKIPERHREKGSMAFAVRLLEEAHVSVAPGIGFGKEGEGYVRFALVEEVERIREACAAIGAMLRGA